MKFDAEPTPQPNWEKPSDNPILDSNDAFCTVTDDVESFSGFKLRVNMQDLLDKAKRMRYSGEVQE